MTDSCFASGSHANGRHICLHFSSDVLAASLYSSYTMVMRKILSIILLILTLLDTAQATLNLL